MKLEPRTLEDKHVRLEPIVEAHREPLRTISRDPAIWRHWPRDMTNWDEVFDWQLAEHAAGRWLLHGVVANGAYVGQTCYLNMRPADSSAEIGGTWYAPTAQGGMTNPACKRLLLMHAFESGAERVELKTDALNARSRAAILKMGATFEGIHRHHMRRPDGSWRDTAWFSVLREEWPRVREGLEARLSS